MKNSSGRDRLLAAELLGRLAGCLRFSPGRSRVLSILMGALAVLSAQATDWSGSDVGGSASPGGAEWQDADVRLFSTAPNLSLGYYFLSAPAGRFVRAEVWLAPGTSEAGLMFSPDSGSLLSRGVWLGLQADGRVMFSSRPQDGLPWQETLLTGVAAPLGLRLERFDDRLDAYVSVDGSWLYADSTRVDLGSAVRSGGAVANGEAVFGGLSLVELPEARGLFAEYYLGSDMRVLLTSRLDGAIRFDWDGEPPVSGAGATNFGIRWSGSLVSDVTGPHQIFVTFTDAVKMWIGGVLVSDVSQNGQLGEVPVPVNLTAGVPVEFVLEYRNSSNSSGIEVEWSAPDRDRVTIPPSAFLPLDTALDSDTDGLPDYWEVRYGGVAGLDASADLDGDGLKNVQEFASGLDPVVSDSDGDGLTDGRGSPGRLLYEEWGGIGQEVVNPGVRFLRRFVPFPSQPVLTKFLDGAEVPEASLGRWGGGRVRGYLVPSVSGDYSFSVTGVYNVELWLSPDEHSWNCKLMGRIDGWAGVGQWTKKSMQQSTPQTLEAGRRYYFEILNKTESPRMWFQAGWKIPGSANYEVIPNTALVAFGAEDDADADFLPDIWEQTWFGDLSPQPQEDSDGDGIQNLDEFRTQLSPVLADTDGDGQSDAAGQVGWVTTEYWLGSSGTSVDAFMAGERISRAPDGRVISTQVNEPITGSRNSAWVTRGYLLPTVTGVHQFELKGGRDGCAFYLSNDESVANLQKLVAELNQTKSATLEAGRRYYFEMVHKVSSGTQYPLSLRWKPPGATALASVPGTALMAVDEVAVAELAPLPEPWQRTDVAVNRGWKSLRSLSTMDANGVLTIDAASFRAQTNSDDVHLVWQTLEGDGEITARFLDISPYPDKAQAGLMVRQDSAAGSPMAIVSTGKSSDVVFGARPVRDGYVSSLPPGSRSGPIWLRLVRSNGWIYAYTSQNGQNWAWLGEVQLAFDGAVELGVFAGSSNNLAFARTSFDSIAVRTDSDGDGIYDDEDTGSVADSDGDGYSDAEELNFLHSDPTVADLSAPQLVDAQAGSSGVPVIGQWDTDATGIFNRSVRGAVDYTISVPTAGIYRLAVTGTPRANATSDPNWYVIVSLDGQTLERVRYTLNMDETGTAFVYTPWLSAGTHTVRLFLDNVSIYRTFTFQEVRLESIGGPDSNGNGIADWQEARLAAQNRLNDQSPTSAASPFCLEGETKYFQSLSLAVSGTSLEPLRGVGEAWYVNVPLDVSGPTDVQVSQENGALVSTKSLSWTPTDLLVSGGVTVRAGDSLLLTATPAEVTSGTATIVITHDNLPFATHTLEAGTMIPQEFAEAGSYGITTTFDDGQNPPVTHSVAVEVKKAKFADPDPVVALGYYRDWINPELPLDAVIESDGRMDVLELPPPAGGGRTFRLRADAAATRMVVSRLDDGTAHGPILDRAEIKAVRASSGSQTGIYLVDEYADGSQLVEMRVVLSEVPDDLRLKFEIFVAGVTFEDGTTVKWFTKDDFNESGELTVRFLRGPGVTTSVCHRLYIYQGDQLLEVRKN